MYDSHMRATQNNQVDYGRLKVTVQSMQNLPIENAKVSISYTGDPESPIEELTTDSSGMTEEIELPAPPLEYSMVPTENQPYAEYTIRVNAEGFDPADIAGTEVLPETSTTQPVQMNPLAAEGNFQNIVIPPHTLYGQYPPKIEETEIKPIPQTGEIVLSRVVIPEFVVVHDGSPDDATAPNYYIRYNDYIKNVASSEIYATWPANTIRANILAIMSFTLNRVYTEWYRNQGYDYTITSSTAFDHKFIYGRNIFNSISDVVDEVFSNYLSRPNVRQPILTQYCDGRQVQCPDWMTQWGSKNLGDQNYNTIDILRHYYGDNMYINTAEEISGIPISWPGASLDIGSSGEKVQQIQEQLNAVSNVYSAIPSIAADGIYGEATQNAVREFQRVFSLPVTGIVDYRTWYRIQAIYVAVTRIAELNP